MGCVRQQGNASPCSFEQPVAVQSNSFAYASTLAVYVFSFDGDKGDLHKILAGHDSHVCGLSWHPDNPDLLACSTNDPEIRIYSVSRETQKFSIGRSRGLRENPVHLRWCLFDHRYICYVAGGSLWRWEYGKEENALVTLYTCKSPIALFCQSTADTRIGCTVCRDNTVSLLDLATSQVRKSAEFEEAATDIQFDPCSPSYMIVAFRNGKMAMYDITTMQQVASFKKQSVSTRRLCFVPGAPGSILTVSNKSSALQLWNVSQENATAVMNTGVGPGQSITFLPGTARAVVTFVDGTVGIYDIDKRTLLWRTEAGHTETVFDCAFSPTDRDLLATCSYDGTVRVWNVQTMKCTKVLTGAGAVLYSLCWCPEGKMICASDAVGRVHMFDYDRGVLVRNFQNHSKAMRSCRVTWHPCKEEDVLASVSNDWTCCVFTPNGTVQKALKHSSGVRGAAWNPFNAKLLATCAESGHVYVWDISKPTKTCLVRTLAGHRLCVFNVQWSPLVKDWLLSGSDDGTARVWNSASGECFGQLKGHTNKVRGILWHGELKNIVITGSWDASIRIWDVTTSSCITCICNHQADVYGIASHPDRPFFLVSSSRDTTIRFWNLLEIFPSVLLGPIFAHLGCDEEKEFGWGLLEGASSRKTLDRIKGARTDLEVFSNILSFLCPPGGVEDFWNLARTLNSGQLDASGQIQHGILFHSAASKSLRDASKEADMRTKMKVAGLGQRKKDALREAAVTNLESGNVHKYCEIMVELGEWDRAILAAPGVSKEYWQSLIHRQAEGLVGQPAAALLDAAPLWIACGWAGHLIEVLIQQKMFNKAFAMAAVRGAGGYDHLESLGEEGNHVVGSRLSSLRSSLSRQATRTAVSKPNQITKRIRGLQAEAFHRRGNPILAACCYLSVEDVDSAIEMLWCGNELELAVAVRKALSLDRDLRLEKELAKKCETRGEWALAAHILKGLPDHCYQLQLAAARFRFSQSTDEEIRVFYGKCGLQDPSSYANRAASTQDAEERVRFLTLAGDSQSAFKELVALLSKRLSSDDWNFEDIAPLYEILLGINPKQLDAKESAVLETYHHFLGAQAAFEDGYSEVGHFLMELARRRVGAEDIDFPVTVEEMFLLEAQHVLSIDSAAATKFLSTALDSPSLPPKSRQDASSLLAELQLAPEESKQASPRSVIPTSSTFPCQPPDNEQQISSVSGKPIVGQVIKIDGSDSRMSLGEAIAVSRCTRLWAYDPRKL